MARAESYGTTTTPYSAVSSDYAESLESERSQREPSCPDKTGRYAVLVGAETASFDAQVNERSCCSLDGKETLEHESEVAE